MHRSLRRTIGKSLWTLYSLAAARSARGRGDKILHRRINKFPASAAERSVQRHPDQCSSLSDRLLQRLPCPQLDEETIHISSGSLRAALALSVADRRWIDFLTQSVQETWDDGQLKVSASASIYPNATQQTPVDPNRWATWEVRNSFDCSSKNTFYPSSHRSSTISSSTIIRATRNLSCRMLVGGGLCKRSHGLQPVEGDPSSDFGSDWVQAWMLTENFKLFQNFTGKQNSPLGRCLLTVSSDSHLFDIVEPRHPCAGGLTIEDVQRRLAQSVTLALGFWLRC